MNSTRLADVPIRLTIVAKWADVERGSVARKTIQVELNRIKRMRLSAYEKRKGREDVAHMTTNVDAHATPQAVAWSYQLRRKGDAREPKR